ncbi:hypothetical protein [Endozoicomonas sp. ALB091]|uniref:hypothetical protein n=1 Tax=Endozoicomonas sp. ALB091 TaxID=3403073 RepID=UPI003BB7A8AE
MSHSNSGICLMTGCFNCTVLCHSIFNSILKHTDACVPTPDACAGLAAGRYHRAVLGPGVVNVTSGQNMSHSNSGIRLFASGFNVAVNRYRVSNRASLNVPCPDTRASRIRIFVGRDVTVHGRRVSNGSAFLDLSCNNPPIGSITRSTYMSIFNPDITDHGITRNFTGHHCGRACGRYIGISKAQAIDTASTGQFFYQAMSEITDGTIFAMEDAGKRMAIITDGLQLATINTRNSLPVSAIAWKALVTANHAQDFGIRHLNRLAATGGRCCQAESSKTGQRPQHRRRIGQMTRPGRCACRFTMLLR